MADRYVGTRRLRIRNAGRGRAVFVGADGTLYRGRDYRIEVSADEGATWQQVTRMPCSFKRRVAEVSRLACRALRHEVRAFVRLSDGTCVAANREGVFHGRPGQAVMTASVVGGGGDAVRPPMTLGVGPNDRVVWGEYFGNPDRRAIRVYVSDDAAKHFEVAHVFPARAVRHIHNIVYDPFIDRYWILTGDFGDEAGMGLLSADLREFEWVVCGSQEYRAVCLFLDAESVVYGTDTEKERNAVMRLDRKTGRVERGMELEGSCIYAFRFGGLRVLSTTVEPSAVNHATESSLWSSRDGDRWTRLFSAQKDRWPPKYFQYGSLVLPRSGQSAQETLFFSGQALKGIDGRVLVGRMAPDGQAMGRRDSQESPR